MQKPPRERIAISLLGVKAEAEGAKGIVAFVVVAVLLFAGRWGGFL